MGGFAATLGLRRKGSPVVVRALPPVALTAVLAAAGTLVVVLVPGFHFAYRAPELRVALETTAALVALLTAGLAYARFQRSSQLDDLLLALALGLLVGTSLYFAAGPIAFLDGRADSFSSWATPFGQLAGALVLAAASGAPPRVLRSRRRAELGALTVIVSVLGGITLVLLLAHPGVPAALSPAANVDLSHPHFVGHSIVQFLQLAAFGAFAAAAVGYARRAAAQAGDPLISAIAIGAVLAAFARVNYLLFPAFSTQWIYTGDAYRLGFYLVVLAGAALEIRRYWSAVAQRAVLEERRRIARDLHDTVAQELAFIARNAARVGQDPAVAQRVVAAAERALADSRRGIAALTRPLDEPVALELEEALEEISHRLECRLDFSLAEGVTVEQHVRHALVRIACEAVTNAARHGGSGRVAVALETTNGVRMRISDGGRGFDAERPAAQGGFGLTSMRGWADAIGASLEIRSQPGFGTEVEVILP
jgi:signal transduction histidine kinase